jgi:hypothetical protein
VLDIYNRHQPRLDNNWYFPLLLFFENVYNFCMLREFPPRLTRQLSPDLSGLFFWEKQMIDYKPPKPLHVQRLRSRVQKDLSLNINQARCWCAAAAIVDPSVWLSWEIGTYEMPAANWQLIQIKALLFDSDLLKMHAELPGVRYTLGVPVFGNFRAVQQSKRLTIKEQADKAKAEAKAKKSIN